MSALEEKYQEKSEDSQSIKPSLWQRFLKRCSDFFIFCSGANKEIIDDYPTERNKFTGIGATIFLTACLASLSGGYAMNLVFESIWLSIILGIFWGIIIFNLDRYIVSSLRKEKVPKQEEIIKIAAPRFIIALLIALVVSKPIELRLFQNVIEKELERIVKTEDAKFDEEEQKRIDELNRQLASINEQENNDKMKIFSSNSIYQDLKEKLPKLEEEINNKEQKIASNKKIISENMNQEIRYRKQVDPETNETEEIPYEVWLPNPMAVAKINENRKLESELQQLLSELSDSKQKQKDIETSLIEQAKSISDKYKQTKDNLSQQIENLNKTYLERKTAWVNANKRNVDLSARLDALGNISKFGNVIWWSSFLITLLFISLETAPVVVKLLTKRGPYDEKLDAIEYQSYIEESKKIDMLNREINEYMKLADEAAKLRGELRIAAEKEKLDIELKNSKKLVEKIADCQEQLGEMYVQAWFEEEKAKAQQQAQKFYKQSNHI